MRKKILRFLFHPPLHHFPCNYGAPRQANHEKINIFRLVSEQSFIPEINFLFIFCPPLKYFEQIVRENKILFKFFPAPF
jgi:hypothetical protein